MTAIEFTYSHAAILVSDIERSASFYKRAVGWEPEFTRDFDDSLGKANGVGGPGRVMMGKLGGVHLQLVEMKAALDRRPGRHHFGLFLCSVMVKDLAPVRKRLEAEAIPITRELDVGRSHLLILTDPDGQEIGIIALQPESAGGPR